VPPVPDQLEVVKLNRLRLHVCALLAFSKAVYPVASTRDLNQCSGNDNQVEVQMRTEIMTKIPCALSAGLLVMLAACGSNPATTNVAPPVLTTPSVPAAAPSAEPAPPASAPAVAVQATPDPATREGRMAEALKGYEASKAAQPSAANGKSQPAKKPQPAKPPLKPAAKAASSPGS
jgi:hypothetical protein